MALDIGSILMQFELMGVFDYFLPFLLIFAFVYGILTKTGLLGKNARGLNVIIALALGAMALQLDFVSIMFKEFFPRLGVGLAVILMLFILVGLFIQEEQTKKIWNIIFSVIGVVIAIVVITQSFQFGGYAWAGYFGDNLVAWIIGAILLAALVIALVMAKGDSS